MAEERPPPDRCPGNPGDLELLERISRGAVTVKYVGTVASGTDYRDIYLVLTGDRVLHIVSVRRLCPGTSSPRAGP